jgi:hypothetical protein
MSSQPAMQSKALRFNREAALSEIIETLQDGPYLADLFANTKVEPAIYHYIITKHGSTEILDWGQTFSMDSSRQAAEQWLETRALRIAS